MNKRIIEASGLIREYTVDNKEEEDGIHIRVLKGIDAVFEEGEFTGIMGKSGCGKTTLLKTLGLIDRPTDGKILFDGVDTESLWRDELADIRRRKIGFVFQDFYLMDSLSVRENIMLPMILDKVDSEVMKKKTEEIAEKMEIAPLLEKAPYELSGGEKQRTAICRALINDPEVILADEPTGNLDSKSGKRVMDALLQINEELGKTVVMVTHDPQLASCCKKIIFLKDGEIVGTLEEHGNREEFYRKILDEIAEL